MRSSKSRSRNKSNRNRSSMGNVVNRVFDSSGPEGKVRGTPQQIIDKYNQLARDSQLSGDRVATENFQQHAEHYMRLLSVAQKEQEARREEHDRANRERQAERDRERAQRQEREANGGDLVDGSGPQPELVDMPETDGDAGLVETPENQSEAKTADAKASEGKPAKPKRQRKPKKTEASDAGDPPAPSGDAEPSEAAE